MKIRVDVLQIFDDIELIVRINMFDFYFVDSNRVNSSAYRDDSIIRRMISDFFCREFLIFSDFVCILRSSLFNQIILRIFFICSLFIIFLMIMIFRTSRSTSSTIKIVNFRACFVVLRLIDLSATTDLIIDSKAIRRIFV
jgi:hypothetical protein